MMNLQQLQSMMAQSQSATEKIIEFRCGILDKKGDYIFFKYFGSYVWERELISKNDVLTVFDKISNNSSDSISTFIFDPQWIVFSQSSNSLILKNQCKSSDLIEFKFRSAGGIELQINRCYVHKSFYSKEKTNRVDVRFVAHLETQIRINI